MNCCNDFGKCTNGKDCPARNVPTLREEVERELGVTAKIGKRYHAAPACAPSHWPKTLRAWATVVLAITIVAFITGFVAGMV
jgi:hypothetical protein